MTVAIDRFSRVIMGFYISFHAPSSFSVLQCLKRAILPKEVWLARFPDIKGEWPARGIPELIACDNGMDLHSDAFEEICLEMGIELLYCPGGEPWMKGAVERYFRTQNSLIHSLPGTVFSNVDERGAYPSEDLAAIDMETLVRLITKWIVEVYHLDDYEKRRIPPLVKWKKGEDERIIEMPAYPQQLEILVGVPAKRTLFHYGVEVDNLRYNCPELQLLRARAGGTPSIKLKYYEDDVGYIHVYDEANEEYIRVNAVDEEYASGLTRHLHRLIREYTQKQYGERWTDERLLESKAAIQEIVKEALKNKKMATRKKSAAAMQHDSEQILAEESALTRARSENVAVKEQEAAQLDPGLDDDLPDFNTSMRTGTEG